jgi:peptidoglycan/LPS O-acetylase OafA/YrhL
MGSEPAVHIPKSGAVASAIPKAALDDMNWLRGLAAVGVLIGHIRGLFFVDFESLERAPAWLKAVYVATGFGHQAVIVFFVLSGFFIGTSVASMSAADTWSWKRFALRRFTRLYVVLVPALLLTTVWDAAGMSLFGTEGIYGGKMHGAHLALPDVTQTLTPRNFLATLAFLQDLFVRGYGSNGPLWSLSYEFWAYVTFPLLYRAVAPRTPRPWRVAFLAMALVILVGFGGAMRFYFAIWSLGALLAILWRVRPRPCAHAAVTAASGATFAAALLIGRLRLLHSAALEDAVLGVATVLFVLVLLARGEHAVRQPAAGCSATGYATYGDVVAGFSYTLYVAHYPVLTFLAAWRMSAERWQPTSLNLLSGVAIAIAVIVLYVYPIARLTEGRTEAVRSAFERALRRTPAVGPRRRPR